MKAVVSITGAMMPRSPPALHLSLPDSLAPARFKFTSLWEGHVKRGL